MVGIRCGLLDHRVVAFQPRHVGRIIQHMLRHHFEQLWRPFGLWIHRVQQRPGHFLVPIEAVADVGQVALRKVLACDPEQDRAAVAFRIGAVELHRRVPSRGQHELRLEQR